MELVTTKIGRIWFLTTIWFKENDGLDELSALLRENDCRWSFGLDLHFGVLRLFYGAREVVKIIMPDYDYEVAKTAAAGRSLDDFMAYVGDLKVYLSMFFIDPEDETWFDKLAISFKQAAYAAAKLEREGSLKNLNDDEMED